MLRGHVFIEAWFVALNPTIVLPQPFQRCIVLKLLAVLFPPLFLDQGHVELLQLLLANGADPGCADGEGRTALHLTAAGNFEQALRLVLEHGAPLNTRTSAGVTPLQCAAIAGAASALRVLVNAGAAVNNQVCGADVYISRLMGMDSTENCLCVLWCLCCQGFGTGGGELCTSLFPSSCRAVACFARMHVGGLPCTMPPHAAMR
jgi:hypothetical protein